MYNVKCDNNNSTQDTNATIYNIVVLSVVVVVCCDMVQKRTKQMIL